MSAPDHWTLTPDLVMLDPTLSAETRLVFYAFLSYADRDGWCHPKQVTLAVRLGMTRQNVAYHLQKLRDRHLLETEKRGKLNHSHVLSPTTPPSIEYVYPIDTSDQTRKWDRRVEAERANGIDASDPERVYPVDTDASTPFAPERSHIERKTEYVPELDLHKKKPAPGEPERARARASQQDESKKTEKYVPTEYDPDLEPLGRIPPPKLAPGVTIAPLNRTVDDAFVRQLIKDWAPDFGGEEAARQVYHNARYGRDLDQMKNPRQFLIYSMQQAAKQARP